MSEENLSAAPSTVEGSETNIITQEEPPRGRGDVSVSTISTMLGLATSSDIKLLETRMEQVVQKMALLNTRLEKLMGILPNLPTGADLERIDVQIGGLKSMVREVMTTFATKAQSSPVSSSEAAPKK
jgi:hypothetical protein